MSTTVPSTPEVGLDILVITFYEKLFIILVAVGFLFLSFLCILVVLCPENFCCCCYGNEDDPGVKRKKFKLGLFCFVLTKNLQVCFADFCVYSPEKTVLYVISHMYKGLINDQFRLNVWRIQRNSEYYMLFINLTTCSVLMSLLFYSCPAVPILTVLCLNKEYL